MNIQALGHLLDLSQKDGPEAGGAVSVGVARRGDHIGRPKRVAVDWPTSEQLLHPPFLELSGSDVYGSTRYALKPKGLMVSESTGSLTRVECFP